MSGTYASQIPSSIPTVADVVASLLAAEGSYQVEGRYIACASRADRARREAAERIVRDAARRADAIAAASCRWCQGPAGADAVLIAGDPICQPCVPDYEVSVFGERVTADTFAPADDSDVAVWETAAGTEAVELDAYAEGYADGAAIESRVLERAA